MKLMRYLAAALWLMLPLPAFAELSMDFYTYQGFDQTVDGFKKIALIFSDHNYLTTVFIAATLGIFIGGLTFYTKSNMRGEQAQGTANALSFIIIPLLGSMVFQGMVMPKGTVHIYDEKTNQYQAVGNVPNLILIAAGGTNSAERSIIQTISNNSASPYTKEAGGLSFQLLFEATNQLSNTQDFYFVKSLKQYYQDCSALALANDENAFNIQTLRSEAGDLLEYMALLRNPAAYTVYYDKSNKTGTTKTCLEMWDTQLKPYLIDTDNIDRALDNICSKNGFDASNAGQVASCKSAINRAIKLSYDNEINFDAFIRNSIITDGIANSVMDENPDVGIRTLTNQAMINKGLGTSIAAEAWYPAVKASITVIILGLFPILMLFMISPLFPKVLALCFSLFVWLALWGVADAYLHQGAIEQTLHAFDDIKKHNMGIMAILNAPTAAQKGLAIMAEARSHGMTIATFIAATLFGLNAYAFSRFGQSATAQADSAGTNATSEVQDPANQGQYVKNLAESNAALAIAQKHGVSGMSDGSIHNQADSIETVKSIMDTTSATTPLQSGAMSGQTSGGATGGRISATQSQRQPNQTLAQTSAGAAYTDESSRIASAQKEEQIAKDLNMSGAAEMNAAITGTQKLSGMGDHQAHKNLTEAMSQANPNMSEKEVQTSIAEMREARTFADIANFSDPKSLIDYHTQLGALDKAETHGYLHGAKDLGMSPMELKADVGRYNAATDAGTAQALETLSPQEVATGRMVQEARQGAEGVKMMEMAEQNGGLRPMLDSLATHDTAQDFARATALLSASEAMGMTPTETAIAKEGANWSMAVSPEQARDFYDRELIDETQFAYMQDGGNFDFSFSLADGFDVTKSQVSMGDSTAKESFTRVDESLLHDKSRTYNNQTTVLDGVYMPQDAARLGMVKPESVNKIVGDQALGTEDQRFRSLAFTAAEGIASVYDIHDTQSSSTGWNLAFGAHSGSEERKQETTNVLYGMYRSTLDGLAAEADNRGFEGEFRSNWISNEFATFNQSLNEKLDTTAKSEASEHNINFAGKSLLENRGLGIAAEHVQTNVMDYQHGGLIEDTKPEDERLTKNRTFDKSDPKEELLYGGWMSR